MSMKKKTNNNGLALPPHASRTTSEEPTETAGERFCIPLRRGHALFMVVYVFWHEWIVGKYWLLCYCFGVAAMSAPAGKAAREPRELCGYFVPALCACLRSAQVRAYDDRA